MKPLQGIPASVLSDKERLADYILARAPVRTVVARSAPPKGAIVIHVDRLKAWAVRPTAMTISTTVHVLVLLGLIAWGGLRSSRPERTTFAISFDGALGESGDGQEAGGSGSAPVLGPDLAEVQAPPDPVPAVQPTPAPQNEPAAPMPVVTAESAAVSVSVPLNVSEKPGGGGGHPASGGTLGKGQGGTGGGIFGARGGHGKGLGRGGGTAASEASVTLGLKWLSAHQEPSGAWSPEGYSERCPAGDACRTGSAPRLNHAYDEGATALALLAFLGAGHTPLEGGHRDVVGRACAWLLSRQSSDGAFGSVFEGMMYNQGIATLAMAELYGMTRDERAGSAAQRGIGFIERAQQAAGGWDYGPALTGRNDTSVAGWQVMAMKSAQAAGLRVSAEAQLKAMGHFIRQARPNGETLYSDKDLGAGRTGPGMAAVGLASRIFLGWTPRSPAVQQAAQRCLKSLPEWDAWKKEDGQSPYAWYYATMGLYQVGGEAWARWNARTRDLLVRHQASEGHAAGSWDGEDRFVNLGGRLVATSLNLMTLEVYYRYLPIYEEGEDALVERMIDGLAPASQLAAVALAARELDRESASAVLRHCLDASKGDEVRVEAACRLMALGDDRGASIMAGAIDRLNGSQAVKAAAVLLPAGHPKALALLEIALRDKNPFVRFSAVRVLSESGGRDAVPLLEAASGDSELPVRQRAAEGLTALLGRKVETPPPAPKVPDREWKDMRLSEILLALEPSSRDEGELTAARQGYADLLEGARQAVGKGAESVRAVELLNRYLYELKGFDSLPPGAGNGAIHLADTLKTKRANCVGLSGLYLALAEDLSLPLNVVSAPNHCFLRLEQGGVRRNIEATDEGKDVPDAEYPALLGDPSLKPETLRSGGREAYLAAFLNSRGAARSRLREYGPALEDYNLSLALDADRVSTLANRAQCLKALGRHEEADRDFEQALALDPAWLPALLGKAASLLELGRADPAREVYEKAAAAHPGSPRALAALGECHRRRGALDEALDLASRALALDARDAPALALKGSVLYQKGDLAGAEAALTGALEAQPEDALIRVQLGRLYCGARRWTEAVAQLEKAVLCDRGGTEARTLLDYAREKAGKK